MNLAPLSKSPALRRRFHKVLDDCNTFEWFHDLGNRCFYVIQLREWLADEGETPDWFWGWYCVNLDEVTGIIGLDDERMAAMAFEGDKGTTEIRHGFEPSKLAALMAATLAAQN